MSQILEFVRKICQLLPQIIFSTIFNDFVRSCSQFKWKLKIIRSLLFHASDGETVQQQLSIELLSILSECQTFLTFEDLSFPKPVHHCEHYLNNYANYSSGCQRKNSYLISVITAFKSSHFPSWTNLYISTGFHRLHVSLSLLLKDNFRALFCLKVSNSTLVLHHWSRNKCVVSNCPINNDVQKGERERG